MEKTQPHGLSLGSQGGEGSGGCVPMRKQSSWCAQVVVKVCKVKCGKRQARLRSYTGHQVHFREFCQAQRFFFLSKHQSTLVQRLDFNEVTSDQSFSIWFPLNPWGNQVLNKYFRDFHEIQLHRPSCDRYRMWNHSDHHHVHGVRPVVGLVIKS